MRTSVAILPLILAAASAAAGTPALAQSHAGHAMPAPVRQTLPEGCVARSSPTADASRTGTAGAPTCPTGAVPVRLPAPAHDMSTMRQTQPASASASPHAGHDMSTMGQAQPAPAMPAGHDMSTMGQTQPAPATASPHAGHDMSTMGQTPPAAAMPAGHDMSTTHQAQPAPTAASPHAGHDMSTMAQTPAGHDMSGMAMPPDVPTSADNPGRPPETPAPAGATSGPTNAADLLFNPAEMAAARAQLRIEHGDARTTAVIIDQLEAAFGDDEDGYAWDAQGWTGGDINRLWWKSEGEGSFGGEVEEAEIQALYSRAFRPFFDFQTGLRQTYRPEGDRTDLVVGIQGLAPYWFEVDAAAFLSNKGELTARGEAEYDQRITNRWILQPRAEVVLSAEDIPELRIGSGLSSLQIGARLRYEFRREFAPYVGVEWTRSFGETADFLEADGRSSEDTRLVVGIRAWF
ncbi:MAG: copper resistance protein B [Brevundimonas sp.]|uniref:copper resistance protein B n=1 Tax=Brevundimonas sp. TaxID=1871086 RepID=UPI00248A6E9F|nr:copper resistance protein B [Brevundimonas sp.]MDI1328214.1 copper resistance protein B [Brevundimonas sp.]